MEAKDTVIAPDQVLKIAQENGLQGSAEAQAEISFKAGIREVVEWIKENRTTPFGVDAYGYYIWENKLQAKLKEWGL